MGDIVIGSSSNRNLTPSKMPTYIQMADSDLVESEQKSLIQQKNGGFLGVLSFFVLAQVMFGALRSMCLGPRKLPPLLDSAGP